MAKNPFVANIRESVNNDNQSCQMFCWLSGEGDVCVCGGEGGA
jgi:hypothetical protein